LNLDVGGSIAEASLVQGVHRVGVTVSLYLRLEAEHSTATELGRQGVPLDVIQKLCGHRKPEEHRGVCEVGRPGAGRGDPTPDWPAGAPSVVLPGEVIR